MDMELGLSLCPTLREEITGGWKMLHNEEFHNLYYLPIIISVIKLRLAGHIGHVQEIRYLYEILSVNLKGRGHLEDRG
jgi:hypothetical protein